MVTRVAYIFYVVRRGRKTLVGTLLNSPAELEDWLCQGRCSFIVLFIGRLPANCNWRYGSLLNFSCVLRVSSFCASKPPVSYARCFPPSVCCVSKPLKLRRGGRTSYVLSIFSAYLVVFSLCTVKRQQDIVAHIQRVLPCLIVNSVEQGTGCVQRPEGSILIF